MKQAVPLQTTGYHVGVHLHSAAPGGTHTGAGGSGLKEAAAHGYPHRSRPLAGPDFHEEESMVEQVIWWELPHVEEACWSHLLLKDFTLYYRHILEQFLKNCGLWEVHLG